MTRRESVRTVIAWAAASFVPAGAFAQPRRRRVVARRPRTKIVIHPRHPIRRPLPTTVVVRPPRRVITVTAAPVYLTPVVWSARVVTLPPSKQLIWQDAETIERDEEWVDSTFGVDATGKALFLGIRGRARLNFADVAFHNGEVQVVDFNEDVRPAGTYLLLDFANGRRVANVRLLAKAESDEAALTVYMGV